MKTSELTGPALDWAVAKAEGRYLVVFDNYFRGMSNNSGHSSTRTDQLLAHQPLAGKWCMLVGNGFAQEIPDYSIDWSQGGPIIEREKIGIIHSDHNRVTTQDWQAFYPTPPAFDIRDYEVFGGPTPLIAAMRCYVASKLGDDIEIPGELL